MTTLEQYDSHEYFLPEGPRQALELAGQLLQACGDDVRIVLRKIRLKDGRYRLSVEVVQDPAE